MRKLKVRRADRCRSCGVDVPVGTEAWWDPDRRVVHCLPCGDLAPIPATPADLAVRSDDGRAGGAARREYERRSARERARHDQAVAEDAEWRRATLERRPILGRVATTMRARPTAGPETQSTTAWKVGAEGEERVAEVLRGVPGIEVLHDRRVPRKRSNIDHVVVGPAGIFVIDAKKWKAGSIVEVRDRGGLFRSDPRLYVGGRDRTGAVDAVLGQVEVVRTALGPAVAQVPIRGVLCFVGARWPGLRPKPKTVCGITAIWPLALPGLVAAPGPHALAVERIAGQLRTALPPAAPQ